MVIPITYEQNCITFISYFDGFSCVIRTFERSWDPTFFFGVYVAVTYFCGDIFLDYGRGRFSK